MIKPEWQRFYYANWIKDTFVRTATVEQLGVYITLLAAQMESGSLPADLPGLHALMPRSLSFEDFCRIWDSGVSAKFEPVTRRWVSTGNALQFGYEEQVPPQNRLQNWFCARAMATGAYVKENGRKGSEKRWKDDQLAATSVDPVGEETSLDFTDVLKDYPKRNDRAGWLEGIRLLRNSISTVEERARFHQAVRAYARKCRGVDRKFVKRFDKFMVEWASYLPHEAVEQEPEAPAPTDTPSDPVPEEAPIQIYRRPRRQEDNA